MLVLDLNVNMMFTSFLLNKLTQKASFQQQQIKVVHYIKALGTPNAIRK